MYDRPRSGGMAMVDGERESGGSACSTWEGNTSNRLSVSSRAAAGQWHQQECVYEPWGLKERGRGIGEAEEVPSHIPPFASLFLRPGRAEWRGGQHAFRLAAFYFPLPNPCLYRMGVLLSV